MQRLADRHNIPQEIVSIWRQEEGEELLEIQRKAIEEYSLLDGASLFVSAPSSAGKTFIGELAAIHGYYRGTRSIYLVPMKALAEEKFAEFQRKYKGFGLNIVISTKERTEYDSSILAGYYDIAIVIFEKMNVLMTQQPSVLNGCGLVVVDEVQLLNDKTRGPGLEILLTKIKMTTRRTGEPLQFVCLSAVLGEINRFHEWLGATICTTSTRPLELHEGVLLPNGTCSIRQANSGATRTESFAEVIPIHVPSGGNFFNLEPSTKERLLVLCRRFVGQGKKVLVFRKWRALARDTAQYLAQSLALPPASQAIYELRDAESTNSKEALVDCLGGGVGFHSSDLSPDARLVVEKSFRDPQGQVQVVCCTSTLAMGVNLPSSVVLVPDTLKPDSDSEEFHEIALTASEYKNMVGRAGRTRFLEEGYSILLANSQAEGTKYWRNYVLGSLDALQPALKKTDLRKIILSIVASGLTSSEDDLLATLMSSYSGYLHWNTSDQTRQAFTKGVKDCVEFLLDRRLLKEDGDLTATRFGKLCAASGIEIDTFLVLQGILETVDPGNWEPFEIIFPCLHTSEVEDQIRIYLKVQPAFAGACWKAIEEMSPRNGNRWLDWSRQRSKKPDGVLRRVLAFLLVDQWIQGTDMTDIENGLGQGVNRFLSGVVQGLGETLSWLVQTLSRIASAMEYPEDFVEGVRILADRLKWGLPADGISLGELRVRGATRPVIRRLVEAGFGDLAVVLDTPPAQFKGIASPAVVGRIQEVILEQLDESLERAKREQAHRLERLGFDPSVLRRIYEADGIPLELAIVDLLNSRPLDLGAEHIATQREGEPDLRVTLPEGVLVGSVTASGKPIADLKCAEIIRSGARFNPSAFIVFGRPSFHELAIKNAIPINNQLGEGKSYKLIAIQELGEIYVRFMEGRIQRPEVISVLLNHKGLLKLSPQPKD